MGDWIRSARESRQLSTQAAAEQAGISPGYLFKLESGYVGTPSPRVLHRLSEVLGIGYWELTGLAGYMVPDGHTAAKPPPADPLDRVAGLLEEIRDELAAIRKRLENPADSSTAR